MEKIGQRVIGAKRSRWKKEGASESDGGGGMQSAMRASSRSLCPGRGTALRGGSRRGLHFL